MFGRSKALSSIAEPDSLRKSGNRTCNGRGAGIQRYVRHIGGRPSKQATAPTDGRAMAKLTQGLS